MATQRQLIVFELGGEDFGIDIIEVKEIIRTDRNIRPLPQTSEFIEGIINLRGEIIVIIDLRKKFAFEQTFDVDTRIMIVEVQENKVGFIVDSASEVMRIAEDNIAPPPGTGINGISGNIMEAIGKQDDKLIILLNLDRVLDASEVSELRDVNEEIEE